MDITIARWAFLFCGLIGFTSGNTALGYVCIVIWAGIGLFQIVTKRL